MENKEIKIPIVPLSELSMVNEGVNPKPQFKIIKHTFLDRYNDKIVNTLFSIKEKHSFLGITYYQSISGLNDFGTGIQFYRIHGFSAIMFKSLETAESCISYIKKDRENKNHTEEVIKEIY